MHLDTTWKMIMSAWTTVLSYWKAISIVSTGAFGMLGLLKDFKDKKTNKVTRWGYVSLIGIIVSTFLGVAAQLKESTDLARDSNTVLHEIERGLYAPPVLIFFTVCIS